MFFPTSAKKQTNKQNTQTKHKAKWKYICFSAFLVINCGRGTTVVLHTHKNYRAKLLPLGRASHPFRSAIERTVIAASCVRAVTKAQPNPTQTHTRVLSFIFSFAPSCRPPPVFDERSRWFVLRMVSAPLSPLSDHLHLLLSIATRLWSCTNAGLQHMPETGSVQNMSRLKVPIKTKLAVMKQLFNVVQVPPRPPPVKMNTYFFFFANSLPRPRMMRLLVQLFLFFPQGTTTLRSSTFQFAPH